MPTQTQVIPYTGVYQSQALTLARDYISGYSGDYLFFRTAEDTYVLVMSKDWDYDALTTDSAKIITLQHIPRDYVQDIPENWLYFVQTDVSFSFQNVGSVFYGSFDGLPHLEDGGAYYGAFLSQILISAFVFVLCVRIFRSVMRA